MQVNREFLEQEQGISEQDQGITAYQQTGAVGDDYLDRLEREAALLEDAGANPATLAWRMLRSAVGLPMPGRSNCAGVHSRLRLRGSIS